MQGEDARSDRKQAPTPCLNGVAHLIGCPEGRPSLKGTYSLIHQSAMGPYSWISSPRISTRGTRGTSSEIGRPGAPAGGRRSRPRCGALGVVVLRIAPEYPGPGASAEHEREIQDLVANGANEPLSKRVGLGGPSRVLIIRAPSEMTTFLWCRRTMTSISSSRSGLGVPDPITGRSDA